MFPNAFYPAAFFAPRYWPRYQASTAAFEPAPAVAVKDRPGRFVVADRPGTFRIADRPGTFSTFP